MSKQRVQSLAAAWYAILGASIMLIAISALNPKPHPALYYIPGLIGFVSFIVVVIFDSLPERREDSKFEPVGGDVVDFRRPEPQIGYDPYRRSQGELPEAD